MKLILFWAVVAGLVAARIVYYDQIVAAGAHPDATGRMFVHAASLVRP